MKLFDLKHSPDLTQPLSVPNISVAMLSAPNQHSNNCVTKKLPLWVSDHKRKFYASYCKETFLTVPMVFNARSIYRRFTAKSFSQER